MGGAHCVSLPVAATPPPPPGRARARTAALEGGATPHATGHARCRAPEAQPRSTVCDVAHVSSGAAAMHDARPRGRGARRHVAQTLAHNDQCIAHYHHMAHPALSPPKHTKQQGPLTMSSAPDGRATVNFLGASRTARSPWRTRRLRMKASPSVCTRHTPPPVTYISC